MSNTLFYEVGTSWCW